MVSFQWPTHFVVVVVVVCFNFDLLSEFPTHRWAFQVAQMVKNPPAMQKTWFDLWVVMISWRREWLPTPVFFPVESHGQRSLEGYSPQGHKESDTIKQLSMPTFIPHIIPTQYNTIISSRKIQHWYISVRYTESSLSHSDKRPFSSTGFYETISY